MASVFIHYRNAIQKFGWRKTLEKMHMMGTVKIGRLVGEDELGNKYYEDLNEYYGQHRWVEYKDIWNYDGSMVPPAWHGWLTHQHDEPGHESELYLQKKAKEALELDRDDHCIYDNHLGHTEKIEPEIQNNLSQFRQRGYKTGSLHHDADAPDKYYKQPGSATSEQNLSYKHPNGYEFFDPDDPEKPSTIKPIRDYLEP
mmetsp:Transcript_16723/g.25129  ORF Transcript_16723/g.25129 Transcript_16723/m.25129 type:complete len:199 (-) Transcript_16723:242-838(-)